MRIHAIERIRVKSWQKTRSMQHVGQRVSDDEDYPRREVCLTGVMTKVRVSERSYLDPGEAGDGRSDAPMDVAMEMAIAVTPIGAETAGATVVEVIKGNGNGKWRWGSEAPATALAPSDWRSRMEKTVQHTGAGAAAPNGWTRHK